MIELIGLGLGEQRTKENCRGFPGFRFEQRSGWWKGNGFGAEQIVCSLLDEFEVLVRKPSGGVGSGLECSR